MNGDAWSMLKNFKYFVLIMLSALSSFWKLIFDKNPFNQNLSECNSKVLKVAKVAKPNRHLII